MDDLELPPEQEYLYSQYHRCWDGCQDVDDPYGEKPTHHCYEVHRFPITKKTAKRIYFTGCYGWERERVHFVDRFIIETQRGFYHSKLRETLLLKCPEPRVRRPNPLPDFGAEHVSKLRREMADAHPDRGGDRDSFQAARGRYLRARRAGGAS